MTTLETNENESKEYLTLVQSALKDSLNASDYVQLDFNRSLRSDIDSLNLRILRVPLNGEKIEAHFLIVKTDMNGHVYSGRFVSINKDTDNQKTFSGSIRYQSMGGRPIKSYLLKKGKVQSVTNNNITSLKAEEPVIDGGELPPVVVSYTPDGGGISYADWYNIVDMAGGYGGYYSPATYTGGGGGGSSSAPVMQVDFEAPESKDAIDVSKYIKCFGTAQPASADYTITICTDLPVDNDPSQFFNWSDASPGHTYIELYKNDNGAMVQQNFGFYPATSWKTVVGPDNIASKIADDAGHEYQAKFTIQVNAAQFQNAINAVQQYSANPYNVAEYNCADFALNVFRAAGGQLNVPQYQIPGFPSTDGSNTPEGVYQSIAGLVLGGNSNATANGQKQWVGESHGPCN